MKHYSLDSNGYLVDSFGGCHKFGDPVLKLSDHLAAIKQLNDRIAQVERDRDRLADELTNTRVSRDSANDRADRAERDRADLQKDVVAAFRIHGLAPGPEAVNGLVRQLAEVSQERDDWKLSAGNVGEIIAKYESTIDELKRGKSCELCIWQRFTTDGRKQDVCYSCKRNFSDRHEPRATGRE